MKHFSKFEDFQFPSSISTEISYQYSIYNEAAQ